MQAKNSLISELPKQYDPASVEQKWYSYWEKHNYFHSEPDDREPYTVVIPPPNVTGVLHMGHMLNNTIQDILVRKARMENKNVCWVPGTDHASIATEAKVVQKLRKKGIRKSDLSRDEFINHAWEWTNEHGGIILDQLKKLGASCDWERTRFTLEEKLYDSVIDCFIDLYNHGYIYRGLRMINWDPDARTALSDEEVIHKEEQSKLYYVRYKLSDEDEYVTIATTRPETILADTGICVNPKDKRYQHLTGKTVLVPIVNRPVPIIADDYVDPDFGTGCLKITPAHDVNDYEIGRRYELDVIDMFNEDGTVAESGLFYVGKDRFEARRLILDDLEEKGHLIKSEDITNKIGYSERTDAVIEPRLSLQWFCKMEDLAKPALDNVMNGQIRFHPEKFKNTYSHWMENIRDWCISRQLWWGQRIPAWYYGDGDDDYVIARTSGEALQQATIKSGKNLSAEDLRQDEDVLDTWFSSWLWPISVFNGIQEPDNKDFNYYYPTRDLVTAPEIMFFWVARMIMAGYAFKGKKPFSNVYFHGIVRDKKRRKMSKSLGNSPDPLDLIRQYGADGTRVGMLFSSPAGNDLMFDEALCEQGRNFSNKIWNAFRFLTMNMEADSTYNPTIDIDPDNLADRWMQSRIEQTILAMGRDFEQYRLNDALQKIYALVWDDFCDWYIELIKPDGYESKIDPKKLELALGFFEMLMKLLHPFMPFITEEIWQRIQERSTDEALTVSSWPTFDEKRTDPGAESLFSTIQQMVSAVRNIQAEMGLSPNAELDLYIKPGDADLVDTLSRTEWIFRKLLKVNAFVVASDLVKPGASASAVVSNSEIYIPLEGLIDLEKERKRIETEIEKTEGFFRSVEAKLSNNQFIENAPQDIIDREKKKKSDASTKLEKLRTLLNELI